MEVKKFGVDLSLIRQLRQFQSSLKRRRKNMPFLQIAEVSLNGWSLGRIQVQARDRRISLIPSLIIPGCKVPAQEIPQTADTTVSFTLAQGFNITITFDEMDQKMHFISALGDLNNDSDSSNGSSPSPEREG